MLKVVEITVSRSRTVRFSFSGDKNSPTTVSYIRNGKAVQTQYASYAAIIYQDLALFCESDRQVEYCSTVFRHLRSDFGEYASSTKLKCSKKVNFSY